MVSPLPTSKIAGFWEGFRKTFREDVTKMNKREVTTMMKRTQRQRPIGVTKRKWQEQRKFISGFIDEKGKSTRLWSSKLGLHSQIKATIKTETYKRKGKVYYRIKQPELTSNERKHVRRIVLIHKNIKPHYEKIGKRKVMISRRSEIKKHLETSFPDRVWTSSIVNNTIRRESKWKLKRTPKRKFDKRMLKRIRFKAKK